MKTLFIQVSAFSFTQFQAAVTSKPLRVDSRTDIPVPLDVPTTFHPTIFAKKLSSPELRVDANLFKEPSLSPSRLSGTGSGASGNGNASKTRFTIMIETDDQLVKIQKYLQTHHIPIEHSSTKRKFLVAELTTAQKQDIEKMGGKLHVDAQMQRD